MLVMHANGIYPEHKADVVYLLKSLADSANKVLVYSDFANNSKVYIAPYMTAESISAVYKAVSLYCDSVTISL